MKIVHLIHQRKRFYFLALAGEVILLVAVPWNNVKISHDTLAIHLLSILSQRVQFYPYRFSVGAGLYSSSAQSEGQTGAD